LLSSVILFSALLNYMSFKVVAISEYVAVIAKLLILSIFIILGFYILPDSTYLHQLSISNWAAPLKLISGGMIIFIAYEGFELIANAVPNIRNPKKNVPRTFYISVISVMILYLLIAVITVGSLSFFQIAQSQDYVLALAAKPMLGMFGFTVIGITALISTFSAINSTLYGGSRVSYELGTDHEASDKLTKIFWHRPLGLIISIVLTLLVANTINLEVIAMAGSAGFLIIFSVVNFANYRLARETKSRKYISLIASLLCLLALIILMIQQFITNFSGALIVLLVIFIVYFVEYLFRREQKISSLSF